MDLDQTNPTDPIIKTCSCGSEFTAPQWSRLPSPPRGGFVRFEPEDEVPDLELKNCSACGSTIAVELKD